VAHNVTFTTSGAPASIPGTSNAAVGVVFPNIGTFPFYCTLHANMTGTVVVQ
jgi:plastocyanin